MYNKIYKALTLVLFIVIIVISITMFIRNTKRIDDFRNGETTQEQTNLPPDTETVDTKDAAAEIYGNYVLYSEYEQEGIKHLDVITFSYNSKDQASLFATGYKAAQYGHPQIQHNGNYYNDGRQLFNKTCIQTTFENNILLVEMEDGEKISFELVDGSLKVLVSEMSEISNGHLFNK